MILMKCTIVPKNDFFSFLEVHSSDEDLERPVFVRSSTPKPAIQKKHGNYFHKKSVVLFYNYSQATLL